MNFNRSKNKRDAGLALDRETLVVIADRDTQRACLGFQAIRSAGDQATPAPKKIVMRA
jgi:hypothetical protein